MSEIGWDAEFWNAQWKVFENQFSEGTTDWLHDLLSGEKFDPESPGRGEMRDEMMFVSVLTQLTLMWDLRRISLSLERLNDLIEESLRGKS